MTVLSAVVWLLAQAPPFELPVASNFILATAVVGFLMSPVISALNRRDWSTEGKAVGAFVWCLIASGVLYAAADRFDVTTREPSLWFGTFLALFVMAIGLYQFYFKPSNIADTIERATG